jgi:hypothetical protein
MPFLTVKITLVTHILCNCCKALVILNLKISSYLSLMMAEQWPMHDGGYKYTKTEDSGLLGVDATGHWINGSRYFKGETFLCNIINHLPHQ